MVARPADYQDLRNRAEASSASASRPSTTSRGGSQSARESLQSLLALSALLDPTQQGSRDSTSEARPEFNHSLEGVRQSLLTMHTLMSIMPLSPSLMDPDRRGL
jgi:hypothetical protein